MTNEPSATQSLTRNAFALVLNTGASALLGLGFWILAARLFTPHELGRDAALLSAMFLLSAVTSLNLGVALPRFLPELRASTKRAVLGAYTATTVAALILGALFVFTIPKLSQSLSFIGENQVGIWFCAGLVLWNIFGIQGGILTGLRSSVWVLWSNLAYSTAKLLLMVGLSLTALSHAIFISWLIPLVIVFPLSIWIFRIMLPKHMSLPAHAGSALLGNTRKTIRFLSMDYIAALLLQGSALILPLLVVASLGTTANAYFAIAFTIFTTINQMSISIGLAFTVEGSFDAKSLGALTRHSLRRFGKLLIPGILVLAAVAPLILAVFGSDYRIQATTLLRLLLLGTIPTAVIVLYQSVERVRGHAGRVLVVQAASFALTILLVEALINDYGITAVGWAWLVTHALLMIPTLPTLIAVARVGDDEMTQAETATERRLSMHNLMGFTRWILFRLRHRSVKTRLFFLSRRADIYIGGRGDLIVGPGLIVLHDFTARLEAPMHVGSGVFFNRGCHLVVKAGLNIGDRTLFGEYVSIHDETHTIVNGLVEDRNSFTSTPVTIGSDVWVGAKVTILPGVIIGDRCIIGAGAVVTKDLPPGSIAAGVPARVLRTMEHNRTEHE